MKDVIKIPYVDDMITNVIEVYDPRTDTYGLVSIDSGILFKAFCSREELESYLKKALEA